MPAGAGYAGRDPAETSQKGTEIVPFYECVLIARQDLSTPQAEALVETFSKVIEDMGGQVPRKEHWGLRTLAYRIRKNRKGHYAFLNLDAPASAVHEMERQMRIHEDVVRHLTVRVDALLTEPSAMMQARASRSDDRGGRGERGRGRFGDDRPRFGEGRPRFGDDRPGGDRGDRGGGERGGRFERRDHAEPAAPAAETDRGEK